MSWPWSALGLGGPADLAQVRRAYAQRLKTTHPEEDPEGFQRLHAAYQEAGRLARAAGRARPKPPPQETPQLAEEPSPPEEIPKESEEKAAPPPPHAAPQAPPPEKAWDFTQLLEPPAPPAQVQTESEAEEEDWDYERLLEEGPPPPAPKPQPRRQDWDYSRLLEEGPATVSKPRRVSTQQDWDYERIFAEESILERARRGEVFRRRVEERRARSRARLRLQRTGDLDEEMVWSAMEQALLTAEELLGTEATLVQWERFLRSDTFRNAKANMDFVLGLEEALVGFPQPSPAIRQAIFRAYGFDSGYNPPALRPLRKQLLGGVKPLYWYNEKRRRQRSFRWGLLWLLLVLISVVWRLDQPDREEARRQATAVERREATCAYLEEDFGRPFISLYDGTAVTDNLFAPAEDPAFLFLAGPDGDRDVDAGIRGYETNYTDRLVMEALTAFAGERELALSAGGGDLDAGDGQAPGSYRLALPLSGAEEAITALGALLEDLAAEDWYRELPPQFELRLHCGSVSFFRYAAGEDGFNTFHTEEVLTFYQEELPSSLAVYLVETSGLVEEDLGEAYIMERRGLVEAGFGQGYLLRASSMEDGRALQYLVNLSEESVLVLDGDADVATMDLSLAGGNIPTLDLFRSEAIGMFITVWRYD